MKTAVEFAFEQLNKWRIENFGKDSIIGIPQKVLEQAKELEKQQIIKAVYDSMGTNLDPNMGRAEQYYNETFKSE
jgi:hypothetical protein